jgi:hypothetical protein
MLEQLTAQRHAPVSVTMPQSQVNWVWHLTHRDNLCGIMQRGLLSHLQLMQLKVQYQDISDAEVQACRSTKRLWGHDLHGFTPTFFVKRNPMMYRLARNDRRISQLVWLKIDVHQLDASRCITADGNAAANHTQFWQGPQFDKPDWSVLLADSWHDVWDGRRLRAAELLYWGGIPADAVVELQVNNMALQHQLLAQQSLPVECRPYDFFV